MSFNASPFESENPSKSHSNLEHLLFPSSDLAFPGHSFNMEPFEHYLGDSAKHHIGGNDLFSKSYDFQNGPGHFSTGLSPKVFGREISNEYAHIQSQEYTGSDQLFNTPPMFDDFQNVSGLALYGDMNRMEDDTTAENLRRLADEFTFDNNEENLEPWMLAIAPTPMVSTSMIPTPIVPTSMLPTPMTPVPIPTPMLTQATHPVPNPETQPEPLLPEFKSEDSESDSDSDSDSDSESEFEDSHIPPNVHRAISPLPRRVTRVSARAFASPVPAFPESSTPAPLQSGYSSDSGYASISVTPRPSKRKGKQAVRDIRPTKSVRTSKMESPELSVSAFPTPSSETSYMEDSTSASMSAARRGGQTRFPCPHEGCPQVCKSQGDLGRHLESLAHKLPSHVCPRCGATFTRKDALKRHSGKRSC